MSQHLQRDRPIVFIGHSFGGLVIKQVCDIFSALIPIHISLFRH